MYLRHVCRFMVAFSVLCLVLKCVSATSFDFDLADEIESDTKNNTARVVNGKKSSINDFPYQVSLLRDGFHFCGGSILNEKWILTAAHCLKNVIPNNGVDKLSVRGGSSNRESGGVLRKVELAINHPQYDPKWKKFDVGLLKLIGSLVYSAAIKSVKLSRDLNILSGADVVLSGWGKMAETSQMPPVQLQSVMLKLVSLAECNSDRYFYGNRLSEMMFCAESEGKGSCQGDSGGPLCWPGSLIQVGIVSFGAKCAVKGYPGVYTNVAHPEVRAFIDRYVKL